MMSNYNKFTVLTQNNLNIAKSMFKTLRSIQGVVAVEITII